MYTIENTLKILHESGVEVPEIIKTNEISLIILGFHKVEESLKCGPCIPECAECPIGPISLEIINEFKSKLEKNLDGAMLSNEIDWLKSYQGTPYPCNKQYVLNSIYRPVDNAIIFGLIESNYFQKHNPFQLIKIGNAWHKIQKN